ncbi:AT-rich interactive domain-containing protein 3A-like [Python bivittatus]|uniref:AT-rich interactive domain-containing protein 3 n=1 Tax=Python bivittatus TaxID=176946 RepID=A0A9F5IZH5_PYTBI|nr:AT-rich interactive domain-containing protein 3A-like [Python bivittatus]
MAGDRSPVLQFVTVSGAALSGSYHSLVSSSPRWAITRALEQARGTARIRLQRFPPFRSSQPKDRARQRLQARLGASCGLGKLPVGRLEEAKARGSLGRLRPAREQPGSPFAVNKRCSELSWRGGLADTLVCERFASRTADGASWPRGCRKLRGGGLGSRWGGSSARLGGIKLYELDGDPKRKEFLDDLFGFMQKRGTPVNRIPIMAKQVLDLYTLYRLVTEKGGLVEVINKKIWREITKGLNLPTSITSAAFTLRTQYMKYLYPYECDKRGLSSPGELQAAIDSNRREGRRQTFGATLFSYSPAGTPGTLASPKVPLPSLTIATHNGSQIGQAHAVKKEESLLSPGVPSRIAIPVSLAGHHLVAAQAAASQAAALEQLREKLETSEPPEKKMALVAEEQQRLVQHALQQNLLAVASQFPVNIKVNSRGDDRQETALNLSTNGISSINMSIEINGVVYTGVLFARRSGLLSTAGGAHSHSSTGMPQSQLLSTASRGRASASTSP